MAGQNEVVENTAVWGSPVQQMDYCTKNEKPNELIFSKAEFGPKTNRTNGTVEDPNTKNMCSIWPLGFHIIINEKPTQNQASDRSSTIILGCFLVCHILEQVHSMFCTKRIDMFIPI